MEWICNKCGTPTEEVDCDTAFLEFEGMQVCMGCDNCKGWWFPPSEAENVRKGEKDCEAKMT